MAWLDDWKRQIQEAEKGTTHYDGCHRFHKSCAILRLIDQVEQLEISVERYKRANEHNINIINDLKRRIRKEKK